MRCRIDRADFFAREEEQGTMAIMVRRTNQILHFNRAGRHIFDVCDRWVELEEFLQNLGAVNTTPAKLRKYFEEILYKLHACGLAKLEDLPTPAGTGCRLAQLSDYMRISRFLIAHGQKGQSCATMVGARYNGPYAVYTRLYEKQTHYILSEQNGELLALLEISQPAHIAGNIVLSISTAVFHEHLDAQAAREQLHLLTDHAAKLFGGHASKLRYPYMHPRQQWMRDALAGCGFVQTAFFPSEIQNGCDMIWYDRML